MQSKEIGEKLMKRTPYGVRVEGIDVLLTIGPKLVRMDYDTANKMAVFLRHAGRIAKKRAGDHSVKVVGFADLTDAYADELEAQRSRDGTAVLARIK